MRMISISMITNQNCANKYLLHYSLFFNFSLTLLYINWITWHTECGTIYKNIKKLKNGIKDVKMYAQVIHFKQLQLPYLFNSISSQISIVNLKLTVFGYTDPLIKTEATTISLLFVKMPSICYALVILFNFFSFQF